MVVDDRRLTLPAVLLAVLLIASAGFRLAAIHNSLPYPRHTDEQRLMRPVLTMLRTGDPNPHFFRYPSLPLYVALAGTVSGRLVLATQGTHLPAAELPAEIYPYYPLPTLVLPVKLLFTAFSLASLLLTGLIARRAFEMPALLVLAPLVLATSQLFLYASWQYVNVDIVGCCSVLLLIWVLVSIEPRLGPYSAAAAVGGCVALAAAAKYNLASTALFVAPYLALSRPALTVGQRISRVSVCGLVAALGFALLNPFVVLDLGHALDDIGSEVRHYSLGHPGATVTRGLPHLAAMLAALAGELGPVLTVTAVIGLAVALGRNRRATLVMVGVPGVHLLFMSLQRAFIIRNALAAVPMLAILGALGLAALLQPLWGSTGRQGLLAHLRRVAALVVATCALATVGVTRLGSMYTLDVESRRSVLGAVDRLVPAPSSVLVARELRLAPPTLAALRSTAQVTTFDAIALPPVVAADLVTRLSNDEQEGIHLLYDLRAESSAYHRRDHVGARQMARALDLLAPRIGPLLSARIRQVEAGTVLLVPLYRADPRWPEGHAFAAAWNELVESLPSTALLGSQPLLVNYPYGPPPHLGDPRLAIVRGTADPVRGPS